MRWIPDTRRAAHGSTSGNATVSPDFGPRLC